MYNKRPLIFLGVGILNSLIDFICYSTLILLFSTEHIILVGILSGAVALIVAYLNHRFITWRDRSVPHVAMLKFFLATGFGLWVIRPLLLGWFIQLSELNLFIQTMLNTLTPINLSYEFVSSSLAFGLMLIIVTVYNYYTYSLFVFKEKATNIEKGTHSKS